MSAGSGLSLVITSGPLAGRTLSVQGRLVVGREQADLTIETPDLSRRHAVFRAVDGALEVEDLGSLNGTYVNGRPIEAATRLTAGDVVSLGETSIDVRGEAAPPEPRHPLWLIVQNGPLAGRGLTVADALVVGRDQADLTIDDAELSRRHAVIRAVDGLLEVRDLGSLNGTWVNGRLINAPTRLRPGDVIEMGRTSIGVRGQSTAETRMIERPELPALAAAARHPDEQPGPLVERTLYALAGVLDRRRLLVVGVWLVLVGGGAWFSLHQADRLSGGGWDAPGSESAQARGLLPRFPNFPDVSLVVVISGRSPSAVAARLAVARRTVTSTLGARTGVARRLQNGRLALLPVDRARSLDDVEAADKLRKALVATTPSLETRVIGVGAAYSNFQDVSKQQLARSEQLGFPLILIILLLSFGTAVAVVAPLTIGFIAVFFTGAVIYWLSRTMALSVFVTNMASMIGIGVAVDYSLFIVSRFRRELKAGEPKEIALRRALSSSGTAVVFSGGTVAISLAGLFLIPLSAIDSMAVGAITVVIVAILASVTLLPALLAIVGGRIERLRVPLPRRDAAEQGRFWQNWTSRILARPYLSLALGGATMVILAIPLLSLRTEHRSLEQLPKNSEVRAATERVARVVGPGALGPTYLITPSRQAAETLRPQIARLVGVAKVGPVLPSADRRLFLVEAVFDSDPESERALGTLGRIDGLTARSSAPHGTVVGGATADVRASQKTITGGLWKIILFILGLSYVLLLLLLRSVFLPLKAVLMNALSVGAAYGVLVAVFQWGWFDWTGYHSPGYIDTVVPSVLLAVTFGLSMDYEVFLLTRIRERYLVHGSNSRAVSEGLVLSAKIISSAALIMIAVFSVFAIAGSVLLRELGVGLAVAVLLDATIVRLVIVPSTMSLLGDLNWWLPRWLDDVLPAAPTEG